MQIKTAAWQLLFLLNVSAKTERPQRCKESNLNHTFKRSNRETKYVFI